MRKNVQAWKSVPFLAIVLGAILWLGASLSNPSAATDSNTEHKFKAGLAAIKEANASKDPKHPGYAEAYALLTQLSEGRHAGAQYHVGVLHMYGLGGARFDQIAGFEMIREAAEGGYPQAQSYLGVLAERGDGSFKRKDEAEALAWYRKAAEGGHCYAHRRLAKAFKAGELGLDANPEQAETWAAKAAACANKK